MLTQTEHKWIVHAMRTMESREVTEMAAAKIYRTMGQLFEGAAQRVELKLVDKVNNRLYNTNIQTEKETANAQLV